MSFPFSNFSSACEAGAQGHGDAIRAASSARPFENVWLEFNLSRDRKREELEKALRRFMDEEGD